MIVTSPRAHPESGLAAVPAFLGVLSDLPTPEHVLEALMWGPLAPYGVRTCRIWLLVDETLVAIVGSGLTPEEEEHYAVLPPELDTGLWRAVRTGSVLTTSTHRHPSPQFDAVDGAYWSRVLTRVQAPFVVRVPITAGDRPVGGMGLIIDRRWPGDSETAATLDCVRSALGVWLTHPHSGAAERAEQMLRRRSRSLALTQRQRQMLLHAEAGLTNPQIAAHLRLSTSSVKQDLLHAMRALGTGDRQEAAARARRLGLL